MLEEISEKFTFIRTYLRILEQPFVFPVHLDLSDQATRKASWKFFFYGSALAAAASAISAKVLASRHADAACPALRDAIEFSGKKVNLWIIAIFFFTAISTHVVYSIFRRAKGKTLREYAPLASMTTGFLSITLTLILVGQAFAMDQMLQTHGPAILEQCGLVTRSVKDVDVTFHDGSVTAIKPNIETFDPLGRARGSSEYFWMIGLEMGGNAVALFVGLMLIAWTARYYDSTLKFSLFALTISSVPLLFVQNHFVDYSDLLSEQLDSFIPPTFRELVKSYLGI